ncbi:restriction endonuclease subunit M/S [bacterium]|nr:restriction endonuclease subunit M/S [bacterium]
MRKSQSFENLVQNLKMVISSVRGNRKVILGEALGLLYIMKAWQILSDENKIPVNLSFENYFSLPRSMVQLIETFDELSKHHNLFNSADDKEEVGFKNIPVEAIGLLFSYIKNDYDLPSFGEYMLYAVKNKYFKGSASVSVFMQGVRGYVKIALKILSSDSSSIYSPSSIWACWAPDTDVKACYYLDNVDNEASLLINFLKIIDKVNILPSSQDPLGNPRIVENKGSDLLQTFDSSILMPFSLPDLAEDILPERFNRFKFFNGKCDKEIAYMEHLLACTTKKIAAFLPIGLSFKEGLIRQFREYLIEKNLVETIVQMPPHMLGANTKDYFLIVINENRSEKNVLFVDLMHKRFHNKRSRKINLAAIENIGEFCLERTNEEDLSKRMVSIKDISAADYSFSVDRYLTVPTVANPVQITVKLPEIAILRRSQIIPPLKNGRKVLEISPVDLPMAGFIKDGKEKKVDVASKTYETYRLEPLDVILSVKGIVGKVGIIKPDAADLIASQAFHIIRILNPDRLSKTRDAKYLYMFFKSTYGQSLLSSITSGNLSPQIPVSAINKMDIPWPKPEIRESVGNLFNKEVDVSQQILALQKNIQSIHGEEFLQILQNKRTDTRKGRIIQKPSYKMNEEEVEEQKKQEQLLIED